MKITNVASNEWVQPIMKNYRMICCDCNLTHFVDFRIVRGIRKGKKVEAVQIRMRRK